MMKYERSKDLQISLNLSFFAFFDMYFKQLLLYVLSAKPFIYRHIYKFIYRHPVVHILVEEIKNIAFRRLKFSLNFLTVRICFSH